jgi:hypothetical protein
MSYARLLSDQLTTLGSFVLREGTVVWVPEPGTHRSYVEDNTMRALVDNSELEWLPPPTAWERLGKTPRLMGLGWKHLP